MFRKTQRNKAKFKIFKTFVAARHGIHKGHFRLKCFRVEFTKENHT